MLLSDVEWLSNDTAVISTRLPHQRHPLFIHVSDFPRLFPIILALDCNIDRKGQPYDGACDHQSYVDRGRIIVKRAVSQRIQAILRECEKPRDTSYCTVQATKSRKSKYLGCVVTG